MQFKQKNGDRQQAKRQVNRLPPERRISDIMMAARAVFEEKGYHNALISDIAERAGVVDGSIYRFFENKRDLLVRVVEDWYEQILRDERQFAGVRGTWNRIRVIVHHHLMTIKREPALSRLVFQELRPDPEYRNTRLFALNQEYTRRVIDVINEAVETGEFRSDISPRLIRDMIYGTIEHHTWAFLRDEGDFDVEKTADSITNVFYQGMMAQNEKTEDRTSAALSRLEALADRLEAVTGVVEKK